MSVILALSSAQEHFVSYDFSKITENSLVIALVISPTTLGYMPPVSMDLYLSCCFKHSLVVFFFIVGNALFFLFGRKQLWKLGSQRQELTSEN